MEILKVKVSCDEVTADVLAELAELLCEFGEHSHMETCDANALVNVAEERWVEEPVESDDDDAELRKVLHECETTQDEEEAEDLTERNIPTLREAKAACDLLQDFVHEQSGCDTALRGHVRSVDDLVKQLELMVVACTVQKHVTDYFRPAACSSASSAAQHAEK